ncbi:melanoma-associated antigen B4-like isoform 1-T4 [Thomomys bottae]
MPRGQKSKQRSRAKRQLTRSDHQSQAKQPAAEEKEESASASLVDKGTGPSGASVAEAVHTSSDVGAEFKDVGAENSDLRVEGPNKGSHKECSSICQPDTSTCEKEGINKMKNVLVEFLLEKFKLKEHVTQADMMKVVNKKSRQQFPEIFKRTSKHLELVFGVELQEIDTRIHSYALTNKLGRSSECCLSANKGFPKTGLVMSLLGVIFMRGNRATEEEIWDFLNALGIHSGKKNTHLGDPRRLITQDLVQDGYLEHRQIPGSDPPRYEYLWGFRAHAETTKMKVLEVLAKINDTVPRAFPLLYAEALKDQEERARAVVLESPGEHLPFDPDSSHSSPCSFQF